MKAEEILGLAAKIERKAAEIYRLLHSRFKEDNTAAYLWYSLALEEEGHAEFIEAEMKMLKTVPDAFGEATVEVAPLLESLKKMEDAVNQIRENPVTLERALCIAMQIEEDMVEKKYADLIQIVSPSLKRVFEELTDMSDHVERLDSAAAKMGLKCRSEKI